MATTHQIYEQFMAVAIDRLIERGYLRDSLDWDVFDGKYTLRIRAFDGRPMVAVGVVTVRKNGVVVLADAVTGKKEEFLLSVESDFGNKEEFLDAICVYAQKLREEAAYK